MVHNVKSFINPYEFDSAEAHRLAKLECSEFVRNLKSMPEVSNIHSWWHRFRTP